MSLDVKALQALGLATQPTGAAAKKNQLGQEDFLKMLVAEMNYQNPLQPQDAGKFMDQIAQLSMVRGMQEMQDLFKGMVESMGSGQALQASALIGRSVMVPAQKVDLAEGGTLEGRVRLDGNATALTVQIFGPDGELARVLNLGPRSYGNVGFAWDGMQDDGTRAEPGLYTIKATAAIGGKQVVQETGLAIRVDSVTLGSGGAILNLQDGRQLGLSDVSEIL